MFEHVGAHRYDEYFRTVRRQLNDDGVLLLHSIGARSGVVYDLVDPGAIRR